MPTRRYKRTIKSDVGQVKSSETTSDVSETPEPRKLEHDAAVTKSPLEIPLSTRMLNHEMVENEDNFTEAPWQQEQTGQTFFELEIRGYCLLQNARLSQEERQMVLAGTRKDTVYTAIVTQLRGAWDDQDLFEEARALERAARFNLPKPTQNGMLNRLRTVSRVMQPS